MSDSAQYETSRLELWSPLRRQLAACGQAKGSPQQWLGTIRNLQKKGVSAVEVEWSGLLELLGDHQESDSAISQLLALAAELQGEPAPKSGEHPSRVVHVEELLARLNNAPPCELLLQRHITDEYVPLVRYEKQQRPAKLPPVPAGTC